MPGPGDVHQQTRARGPPRLPAGVRRARAPEGEHDRQERARPGAGEGRRRARHRQLAPRAHQRGRCVRRCCARVRGLQALRRRLVAALRRGRVRDRDDPRDPDPADATARARRRAAAEAGTGRDAHAEHPARFERDGRAASERRLPGVLRRVLAQARSPCLGRGGHGGLHRQLHRRARGARAPSLGARRGDPRVVARAPRDLCPARCAGGRGGRLRARRVHARDRRRGRPARVRQPLATRRSRCRTRAAPSPSSRPASSSSG